jgi:hypothetical protein
MRVRSSSSRRHPPIQRSVIVLDRNFPGVARIKKMTKVTHVLIRLRSSITLRRVSGFFPDGSWLADVSGSGETIRMRIIEYDVDVDGQDVPETFCLATDLLDWSAYPAAVLAAAYKWRFLSALGVSAGVGVSSARARVGCRNVAAPMGPVSHSAHWRGKRVCRKSLFARGAQVA